MQRQIQAFVEAHPDGWGHHEWLGLLADLESAGEDVSDAEAIGARLEEERLGATLRGFGVKGLGPKRIEAVVDRFGTLWSLSQASADDIAEIKTIPSALAGQVAAAAK